MTTRKKKHFWKDASSLTKAGAVVSIAIGLFTLSGLITGKLQKWIVEPVTEPISKRQDKDSTTRYWQRQRNSDTTKWLDSRIDRIEKKLKLETFGE